MILRPPPSVLLSFLLMYEFFIFISQFIIQIPPPLSEELLDILTLYKEFFVSCKNIPPPYVFDLLFAIKELIIFGLAE